MIRDLKIAITTGDPDGIGSEVTAKALAKLGPQRRTRFYLWRSASFPKRDLKKIDLRFKRLTVDSWQSARSVSASVSDSIKKSKNEPLSAHTLIDIVSSLSPAKWVEQAAIAAREGEIDAIATAPLSKTAIADAGLADIGHTDILKRVSGQKTVFMGFVGDKFNVVLATGHIPLKNVSTQLTPQLLLEAISAAEELRRQLPESKRRLPVGLLGLNPHAGEAGLIGNEESLVHSLAMKMAAQRQIKVSGPLVPDAAFLQENWKKYSVFVASYHDQGLIPFKMVHGQKSGVHISLGLPFVRTSVDHGTAKDLFGKNRAEPASMLLALRWAIKLARGS